MANGHGGKRDGAGRKPGMDSKAKRELIDLAKGHAPAAVQTLVDIMGNVEAAEGARISAAIALLDRGFGKPTQMIVGPGEDGEHVHEVKADEAFARLAGRLGGASS